MRNLLAAVMSLIVSTGCHGSPAPITSCLGHAGPALQLGVTPRSLGWGDDGLPYPDRFVVNPKDGAELVWVPAGKFRMGSTQAGTDVLWRDNGWDEATKSDAVGEGPEHEVTLTKGFWLYKHEVTNGQYSKFVAATGHRQFPWSETYRPYPDLPVCWVAWNDALAYSQWAGGALPTEAQWEWSGRGPNGNAFPWGNRWDRAKCNSPEFWSRRPLANAQAVQDWLATFAARSANGNVLPGDADIISHLKPVGNFPEDASWCGALDLAGNVGEWCADWYGRDYYAQSPATDPQGPPSGEWRVLRGGFWDFSLPQDCRLVHRSPREPRACVDNNGFRPVVSPG